jgi:hypothetical protein
MKSRKFAADAITCYTFCKILNAKMPPNPGKAEVAFSGH